MGSGLKHKNKKTYYFNQDNFAATKLSLTERFEHKQRTKRVRLSVTFLILLLAFIVILMALLNKNLRFFERIDHLLSISADGKDISAMNDSELYAYLRPGQESELGSGIAPGFFNQMPPSRKDDTADVFKDNAMNIMTAETEQTNFNESEGGDVFKALSDKIIKAQKQKNAVNNKEVIKSPGSKEDTYIVSQSKKVDNSYFSDAAFIGDSRTEGLFINTSLTNASFFAHKGLSVDKVFTDKVIEVGKKKETVFTALKQKKYKKVYLMFGVNELGWPYENVFKDKYIKVVEKVKELQPDAIIYVQEILPVTAKKEKESKIYTNKKIKKFNKVIREVVREEKVYYLAVADAVKNTKGVLPEEASTDGVHLTKSYYIKWLEYLKKHTIVEN